MLVKLEFDKDTNLVSFKFSDSAPEFLKIKYESYAIKHTSNFGKKINEYAKKYRIENCTIIFPSYGLPTNKCSNFTGEIRPENYNKFDTRITSVTAYIRQAIATNIAAKKVF